jgi:hypothetical protein
MTDQADHDEKTARKPVRAADDLDAIVAEIKSDLEQ